MSFILDIDKLNIEDIILDRNDSLESKRIRQVTKSEYSHARLYIGNCSTVEATGLGVAVLNSQ